MWRLLAKLIGSVLRPEQRRELRDEAARLSALGILRRFVERSGDA